MNVLILFIGYFVGSLPFSYLVGKRLANVDLRTKGSGNLGATNVIRIVGKKAGVIAFVLDFSKGLIAYLIGYQLGGLSGGALAGAMAVFGHCYSVFMGFKGGKGVSTTVGVLVVSMPLVALLLFAVQIITVGLSKYMSLGSMVSGFALPFIAFALEGNSPLFYMALFLGPFVIYRHHSNLKRLLQGQESKFIKSKS